MWIEDLSNGGFKYFERYKSPSTKKMEKRIWHTRQKIPRTQKVAQTELSEKIVNALSAHTTSDMLSPTFMTD